MTEPQGPVVPATKPARHAMIERILARHVVHSQSELAEALADRGLIVTQATLSRDLVELRAEKVRALDGSLVYALPGDEDDRPVAAGPEDAYLGRLARRCAELLVAADSSGSLVVLRTPPGAAQFLASAIDQSGVPTLLGTIAGDDTVLVIVRAGFDGSAVATWFTSLAGPSGPAQGQRSTVTETVSCDTELPSSALAPSIEGDQS